MKLFLHWAWDSLEYLFWSVFGSRETCPDCGGRPADMCLPCGRETNWGAF